MTENPGRTLVCGIVFIDIVEYSKKSVTEQLQLKQLFNSLLGSALQAVSLRDRVVLDTGDGAAVTFLGDPEDALDVGISVRDAAIAAGRLALRIGINLGPVRLMRDLNDQLNIVGDGINVAQRVMSFAEPGQLLVSHSYFEVVSRVSGEHAALFSYVGARTDKHVREHQVYLVGKGLPPRRAAAPPTGARAVLAALDAPGAFGLRRHTLIAAPLLFVAIVGTASGIRLLRAVPEPPVAAVAVDPAPLPAPARAPAPAAPPAKPGAAPVAKPAAPPAPKPAAKTAKATGTGRVELVVRPVGLVLVDGEIQGLSPPLRTLDLAVGRHTIEVRNPAYKTYVEHVEVRTDKPVRVVARLR